MRKYILAAVAALALGGAAEAHDYSGDLVCQITDRTGNALGYTFANNTWNANGSFGGTYVETGFVKNNQTITSADGTRPIWFWNQTGPTSASIDSRNGPGWSIGVYNGRTLQGLWQANATLTHNGNFVGSGFCDRRLATSTPAAIPPNAVTDQVYG